MICIVDDNHSHAWSDALHAKALAKQAHNDWDRGSYVRWAIISAWVTLEIACQDALEKENIGYSFERDLNTRLDELKHPRLDWSKGTWQRIKRILERKKDSTHKFSKESIVFPLAEEASFAVKSVKEAVIEIYNKVSKPYPEWINQTEGRGWDSSLSAMCSHAQVIEGGAKDDPERIEIVYVYEGKEYTDRTMRSTSSIEDKIEHIIKTTILPLSEIKAVQNGKSIHSRVLRMRGQPIE